MKEKFKPITEEDIQYYKDGRRIIEEQRFKEFIKELKDKIKEYEDEEAYSILETIDDLVPVFKYNIYNRDNIKKLEKQCRKKIKEMNR